MLKPLSSKFVNIIHKDELMYGEINFTPLAPSLFRVNTSMKAAQYASIFALIYYHHKRYEPSPRAQKMNHFSWSQQKTRIVVMVLFVAYCLGKSIYF